MANYKLNTLQFHMTDNPSWRLKIDKYPKLTEVGSKGNVSTVGQTGYETLGETKAEFYTKEDIREIIEYAETRFVQIIPEIEMPGHCGALNRSYPELGDGHVTLNMAKKSSIQFMKDVLDEVLELFPSKYIHHGGDEVRNINLENMPEIADKMKEKGYESYKDVEADFDREISNYLISKNRTPITWEDAGHYNLSKKTVFIWWRHMDPDLRDSLIQQGYNIIINPINFSYYGYAQKEGERGAPMNWGGRILNDSLIYTWKPVPEKYSHEQKKQILGLQSSLWSEFIENKERHEFMTFPRIFAYSEVAWSPEDNRDWQVYKKAREKHFKKLKYYNVNYRNPEQ